MGFIIYRYECHMTQTISTGPRPYTIRHLNFYDFFTYHYIFSKSWQKNKIPPKAPFNIIHRFVSQKLVKQFCRRLLP